MVTFSVPREGDLRRLEPQAICVDSHGNILIADDWNEAVMLYDRNGYFVREMLKMSGEVERMTLYNDRYLAVTVWLNKQRTLYMYELS
jgi:hypothetical protein